MKTFLLIFLISSFVAGEAFYPNTCQYHDTDKLMIANCRTMNDYVIQNVYDKNIKCTDGFINCNGFLFCGDECSINYQGMNERVGDYLSYYDIDTGEILFTQNGDYIDSCHFCYYYEIGASLYMACKCENDRPFMDIISTLPAMTNVNYTNCYGYLYYFNDKFTECPEHKKVIKYSQIGQRENVYLPTLVGNFNDTCKYCYIVNSEQLICNCRDDYGSDDMTQLYFKDCINIVNKNGNLKCIEYFDYPIDWRNIVFLIAISLTLILICIFSCVFCFKCEHFYNRLQRFNNVYIV